MSRPYSKVLLRYTITGVHAHTIVFIAQYIPTIAYVRSWDHLSQPWFQALLKGLAMCVASPCISSRVRLDVLQVHSVLRSSVWVCICAYFGSTKGLESPSRLSVSATPQAVKLARHRMGRARFVNFVVSCAVCDPGFASTRGRRFYVLPPSKQPANGVQIGVHCARVVEIITCVV